MDSVEFFCFIVMPLTMIVVVIAAIIIATIAGRTADYFSRENIEKRHRKNAQNRMRRTECVLSDLVTQTKMVLFAI